MRELEELQSFMTSLHQYPRASLYFYYRKIMSQGSSKSQLKHTIAFSVGPHPPRRHHEQLVSWLFAEAESI
jgi:hypothetical protein